MCFIKKLHSKQRFDKVCTNKFRAVGINEWHPLGEHDKNHKMAYMENEALVYLRAN
jgi:hypothetical protein